MKKFFSILLIAIAVFSVACTKQTAQPEQRIYTIDEVYAAADSLTGDTILFQGVCAHLCKHGGRKAFLIGSDESRLLRVEGASMGNFAPECLNNIVRVKGIVRAQEVLPEGVEQVSDGLEHGEGGDGCETSKKAIRHYYAEAVSYEIITE